LYRNNEDVVVAGSEQEADEITCDEYKKLGLTDYFNPSPFIRVDEDTHVTIYFLADSGDECAGSEYVKTAGEWAEANGKGYICRASRVVL
jgi:hypothetical protein